jgi:hypothetical protein
MELISPPRRLQNEINLDYQGTTDCARKRCFKTRAPKSFSHLADTADRPPRVSGTIGDAANKRYRNGLTCWKRYDAPD